MALKTNSLVSSAAVKTSRLTATGVGRIGVVTPERPDPQRTVTGDLLAASGKKKPIYWACLFELRAHKRAARPGKSWGVRRRGGFEKLHHIPGNPEGQPHAPEKPQKATLSLLVDGEILHKQAVKATAGL